MAKVNNQNIQAQKEAAPTVAETDIVLVPVTNPEGEVQVFKVKKLRERFPKVGIEQKIRDGGDADWNVAQLEDDVTQRGFRPLEGPEMCAFEDEPFLADGNTRASALLRCYAKNTAFGDVKVPIRMYPASTPAEKRTEIRIRAARLTREWTRADWIKAGVEECLSYGSGRIPELTLIERMGIERFQRQYPNALIVAKDKTTGKLVVEKIKNRQALQTLKRLAYDLPRFCMGLYTNRLKGLKPNIGDQDLTGLASDWEEDCTIRKDLSADISLEDLHKTFPESKLLARLGLVSEDPSGKGRKAGAGAMRVDDLKAAKATFAGGDVSRVAFAHAAREPGFNTDDAVQDMKALDALVKKVFTTPGMSAETLATAQGEYSRLVTRIFERASKAQADAAKAAVDAAANPTPTKE